MSRIFRQYIVYLLIALLPLQAFAASRLALCAEMGATQTDSTKRAEHCAQMASMATQSSAGESSLSHHNSNCWLGSTCLAGMILLAVPAAYAGLNIERSKPIYLPQTALYHSVISENPLRPPAPL